MLQCFNTYASLITALATVVLAVITGIYAYLLRRQTKEYIEAVNNQTRESAKPKLAIRVNGARDWEIENVGKGTAFYVKVKTSNTNSLEYQGYPLAPNDYFRLTWDFTRWGEVLIRQTLASGNQPLSIEISYQDIYSNLYRETIDVQVEWSTDDHNAALFVTVPEPRSPRFIINL